jgi:hypothetical protein
MAGVKEELQRIADEMTGSGERFLIVAFDGNKHTYEHHANLTDDDVSECLEWLIKTTAGICWIER